jgi:hypothetical protein
MSSHHPYPTVFCCLRPLCLPTRIRSPMHSVCLHRQAAQAKVPSSMVVTVPRSRCCIENVASAVAFCIAATTQRTNAQDTLLQPAATMSPFECD